MFLPHTTREEGKVYIDELAVAVHRKVATIRKWDNKLPKYLKPKRGKNNWRYWTPAQAEKLVEWMQRMDMRPGRLLADPELEYDHVENLRKPKYINGHHIKSVKVFVAQGKSREWIVRKIFPRTKYVSPDRLEAALVKFFDANGWDFPPPSNSKPKLNKVQKAEIKRLESKIEKIEGGK